jgi:hypothetical protein
LQNHPIAGRSSAENRSFGSYPTEARSLLQFAIAAEVLGRIIKQMRRNATDAIGDHRTRMHRSYQSALNAELVSNID